MQLKKLKNIIENLEIFYNIYNDIIEKCEKNKNRNYNLLLNLHYINDSINDEINIIQNNYNFGLNLNELNVLYEEMNEEKVQLQKSREKNELITINFLITSGHKHFIKCKPDITLGELISYFYESLNYKKIKNEFLWKVIFLCNGTILLYNDYPKRRIDEIQIYDGAKIIVLDQFDVINACFQNKGYGINNEIVDIISEINKIEQFNETLNNIKEHLKPLLPQTIRILFRTTQGQITYITVDYGTTIDELLRKYLKIKNKEHLYGDKSNRICFLYNAWQLKFGDISVVEKVFKNITEPKIVVNDVNNLIGGSIAIKYSHFEKLYEKLMLLLEPLLEPAIKGEITIKFNKNGDIIKIKMDERLMVAELLNEYFKKTNTMKCHFQFNEKTLKPCDTDSLAEAGLKNNSEIIVS